ncbi:amidase domain-containing protein [Aquibacillus sp. 3ASR75-11]|uniref:Amidase domain-containing protein n=1 Tax=Terrihalobacillus insolitus TaxID=2950438 RepID=A0A9X4ANK1_9BACI|nr:amidase domain-containing protein [Terrihalobacillus insolitus]MDC3413630.1 amidase domain-containing protein [Terrihalobacillus insolitus]MDC3424613.1 amidase domain-containing protein [Terrihalobacillus insolitus]
MDLSNQIGYYWQRLLEESRDSSSDTWILHKKKLHETRGNRVPKIMGSGDVFRKMKVGVHETKIQYQLGVTFLVKQGDHYYHEQEERTHEALFYKGKFIEDNVFPIEEQVDDVPVIEPIDREASFESRFEYDRRAAVQYAERWWNSYNPNYKQFDVDCTNYISQCLYAGGAPMRGAPSRSTGWWYQQENWSYSWAVAHSLRWYLSGSNQGLKGKEVEDPKTLQPGDVICYDFEGDGRFDHSTIVVAKDKSEMPLVNAHTTNSRHRYWSYEDSPAYTEDTLYKFFRIG